VTSPAASMGEVGAEATRTVSGVLAIPPGELRTASGSSPPAPFD